MRILLIKTSSLGDVIHNLPVLSDLARAFPDATVDWCVEEAFADIPRLHPGLHAVIPVALRRWRKGLGRAQTWREMRDFRDRIGASDYDFVLDTQGLVKSALIAGRARGIRLGYAADSAREPLAARFYDRTFSVPRNLHAVTRNRLLAAAAFGLPADFVTKTPLAYGIVPPPLVPPFALPWLAGSPRHAVLLSATSRDDKLWAEENWIELGRELAAQGITPVFPGGSPRERERAARLAAAVPGSIAAPPVSLREAAALIGNAAICVGVDTGLVHLAAALGTPTLAIYTATQPALTGALGGEVSAAAGSPCGFVRNLGGKDRPPTVAEVLALAAVALDDGERLPGKAQGGGA
ncbi:lipopolysaccharide heptosyltransferase I [Rhodocyclus purpureus]|nr:lipopolysaccharide heptosyltransferase I [Rhodocyclus purpureus]